MNNATQTPVTEVTETTVVATPAAPAAPKAPSKKSLALAVFQAKMVERTQGLFATNKEFRAAVLLGITTGLGVSMASAATMYNAAKSAAEAADATVTLGRDPKKVKIKSATGKRGRPAGSKNAPKVAPVVEVTTEAAPAAEVAAPAAAEPALM
jgi:hypothetical protein